VKKFLGGVSIQYSGGDRVIGFWGDRVMRQLPHFPTPCPQEKLVAANPKYGRA